MASAEFEELRSLLPRYWGKTEFFAKRSEYIEKVRASSLTADEVGQLRAYPITPAARRVIQAQAR